MGTFCPFLPFLSKTSLSMRDAMTTITLQAEEHLIASARARAQREQTTLDEQFRRWLERYAQHEEYAGEAVAVIQALQAYARTGGQTFTRDERNAR